MGYDEKLIKKLEDKAQKLRRDVVISIGVGVAGHIGGSNSSADIVAALYFHKMRHDPKHPEWRERDRFLLSKGHVGILQYAALAESGYFPVEDLKHTKEIGSYLQGHPDVQKTPGIEAGTGSLGQGLSIGLGMALGLKLDRLDSRTYVLVGDGEIAEGQIWNTPPAASASPTVLVYTRLASFSCPWNMKMENRVPPPAPIIRPVALMTLYTEIARLRAARPLVPSALDTKYVSARI